MAPVELRKSGSIAIPTPGATNVNGSVDLIQTGNPANELQGPVRFTKKPSDKYNQLNLLADYAGGGMHAAIGVLAALLARHQTGRGQYVDIAMLDGTMLASSLV